MAVASDLDNQPMRPAVLYDSSIGWTDSGRLEDNERSALQHVRGNYEARQQAEAERQAIQQAEAQAKANQEAITTTIEPHHNTGHGEDRPAGTYAKLNAETPAPERQTPSEQQGAAEMTDAKAAKLAGT